ncbi:MAG TPA: hypothetical protein VHQ87_15455 [Rhizobacter sp.]|jgi:hypothetical protein|nr:hypothetical protein [Rhizobacter sp.]
MSRHQPAFKSTQIFDWDSEPANERPSDFARSTGFSTLNGHVEPPSRAARRRRREYRNGFARLMVVSALILGLSIVAMFEMVRFLKP